VVLAVGQEKMNLVDEEVIKAMGAFGGGIASTGKVCGALLGGVAFISSLYSRGNLEEKEDPNMWRLSHKLAKKFEELTREFGSSNCSDIARVNWSDREQVKEFYNQPDSRHQYCIKVVEDTAFVLGELLDQAERETK
jgi:C_GCAxxG_C_C family probable redox protein